jgi:hypothetical protein
MQLVYNKVPKTFLTTMQNYSPIAQNTKTSLFMKLQLNEKLNYIEMFLGLHHYQIS